MICGDTGNCSMPPLSRETMSIDDSTATLADEESMPGVQQASIQATIWLQGAAVAAPLR